MTADRGRMRNLFERTTVAIRCQNYEYTDLEDWVADDDVPFLVVGCTAHPFPVKLSLFLRLGLWLTSDLARLNAVIRNGVRGRRRARKAIFTSTNKGANTKSTLWFPRHPTRSVSYGY